MGVVIAPNLVLPPDIGLTLDHPIVGWRNIVTESNTVATSEWPGYPVTNLANPATHLWWWGSTAVLQYITVTPGSADDIDYFAIARHYLASAGVAVSVEADNGSGFVEIVPPIFPANDGPIVFRFTPSPYVAIRLKLSAGISVPGIAVAYVGKLLVLPRKLYQGVTPTPHARVSKIVTGLSESGDFLGRIETQRRIETTVPLSLIDPAYYREHIDEFLEVSKTTPFFFGWRPESYPNEVGYCMMLNDPQPVNESPHGLIAMDFEMTGVV